MTSVDIGSAFTSAKEALEKVGIESDFFTDLIASRLVIERVGESDNMEWWDSRVLSETGRTRLSEVTPKTRLKSQISLALKIGHKVEADQLPDDSISLFSFGPQTESRIAAAIEEIEASDDLILDEIEGLSVQSLEQGWTDEIITETASNISVADISESQQQAGSGDSLLLDEESYTQDEIEPDQWRILTTILWRYGQCTDQLQVPYYTLELGIKPDNA